MFFHSEPEMFRDQLIDSLYARLDAVRRAINVKPDLEDAFDMGIDCRLANEKWWLETLLANVEKSR
jgi:hypothetical protein